MFVLNERSVLGCIDLACVGRSCSVLVTPSPSLVFSPPGEFVL